MAEKQKYIRINDVLLNILDSNTNEYVTYTKTTTWYDGSLMDDTKKDKVIYRKFIKDGVTEYFKRNFTTDLHLDWWGVKYDESEDAAAQIEECYKMSNLLKIPIKAKAGRIRLDRPVIINGNYWNLQGDPTGTIFTYKGSKGKITSTTAAEPNNYPTTTNAGHIDGCCFYFTTTIYNAKTENVTLADGRFGMAFLIPHNSPIFKNVIFANVNCGVIFYTGCQNPRYINCTTQTNTNCLHISSATCFDTNHPRKNQDNYMTDGFYISNTDGYGSFSNIINNFFDDWFIDSILKPTVPSYVTGWQNFLYGFDATSEYSRASGRSVFVPFRAGNRDCFDPTFVNLDYRGPSYRGIALINTAVSNLTIDGGATEGIFTNAPVAQANSTLYVLGAAKSGTFKSATSEGTTTNRALISFTGKGFLQGDSGYEDRITFLSMNVVELQDKKYQLWKNGNLRSNKLILNNTLDTTDSYDSRASGGLLRNLTPYNLEGIFTGNFPQQKNSPQVNFNNSVIKTSPFMFDLPFKCGDGKYRNSAYLNTANYWVAGKIRIDVFNVTQSIWDYGEFYVQDGLSGGDTYTTAADVNNEDLFITLTANPSRTPTKYNIITVGGVKQIVDWYDTTNRRIYIIGAISGLGSTLVAGSSITRDRFILTIEDFKRDYVNFGFSAATYASSMSLVSRVHASETTTITGDILRVFVTFESISSEAVNVANSAFPTTGRWKAGTFVTKSPVSVASNGDTLLGWKRLTTGTNNTLGTDWLEVYAGVSRTTLDRKANVTGATSIGLNVTNEVYVYVGAVNSIWTLPVVTGNTAKIFYIKNRSTNTLGSITLNSNTGANDIFLRSAVSSLTIKPGKSVILVCDGTYWNVISSQDQQQISTVTFDGTSTTYNITHGLTGITTTSIVMVTPRSTTSPLPACTADGTNIILSFTTAPAAGTGNYSFNIIP